MENSAFTPENNNTDQESFAMPPVRSSFLTVICILTFIGSGIGIFNGITGIFTGDRAEQELREANEEMEDAMDDLEDSGADEGIITFLSNIMTEMDKLSTQTIRNNSIAKLLANLLTLLGAILIWRLQRRGFFIYIAGIVLWVFSPMLLIGGMLGAMVGIAYSFAGVLFIILYAANYKQLS